MDEQGTTKRRIDVDKDSLEKRLREGHTEVEAGEQLGLLSQDATSSNVVTSTNFNHFAILSFDEDGECTTVTEPATTALMDIVGSDGKANVCDSDVHFKIPSLRNEQDQIAFNFLNETSGLISSSDPMCQQTELHLPMNMDREVGPKVSAKKVSLEHQEFASEHNANFNEIFSAGLDSQAQHMGYNCEKNNLEVRHHVGAAATGLLNDSGDRQDVSQNGARVISNSGSCDNSYFEFPSGLGNLSGIEHKEEPSDDSFSSLSPISIDSSDDNLVESDIVELANKFSRDMQSFMNVEDTLAALIKRNSDASSAGLVPLTDLPPNSPNINRPIYEWDPPHAKEQMKQLSGWARKSLWEASMVVPERVSSFGKLTQTRHELFPHLYSIQSRKPTDSLEPPIRAQSTVAHRSHSDDLKEISGPRTLQSDSNSGAAGASQETKQADKANKQTEKGAGNDEEGNRVRDFYEDDSSLEDCSDDDVDNRADIFDSHIYSSYEQLFHEIRKIVNWAPNRFKYEINSLLYPILAIGYLRMIYSSRSRRAKLFVENFMRYIDQSYMVRVKKLMMMQMPSDVPNRAKRLIYDDNEQVAVRLTEETYYFLLVCIEGWSRSRQMMFMRHFDLFPVDNNGEPRKMTAIGSPVLEKINCAMTDIVKETKETSPRHARRKRVKKDAKNSTAKKVATAVANRLFIPTPSPRDVEREKEDKERRVPLDRDNLPSVYLYTAHENVEAITCASFSNNTTILAVGTTAAAIHCFSLTSSELSEVKVVKNIKRSGIKKSKVEDVVQQTIKKNMRRTLYGHQGPVYGCSFAPHDCLMLSCSQDRTIRCWCLKSWNCVVIYPGHCAAIYNVVYAPLGYYFATASDDQTARIWRQDSKKPFCIMCGHLAEVVCCRFHPNRYYLATGSADCTARLWDVLKASQVRVFSGHRDIVNALCFSACGKYLMTGADDHFVIVWDLETESMVRSLSHHKASINCIEIAVDNKLVIVGGQDCQMSIWDFEGLIQAYDADKQTPSSSGADNSKSKNPKLRSKDFLINSYASKGTPFYKLQVTGQNLLIGFCVRSAFDDQQSKDKQLKQANEKYTDWLEFLDILKLKACFAKSRNPEANPNTNTIQKEDGSAQPFGGHTDKGPKQNAKRKEEKVLDKKTKRRTKDKMDRYTGEKSISNAECVITASKQKTPVELSSSEDDGQPDKAATEKDAGSVAVKQPGHKDKGVESVVHDTSSGLLKTSDFDKVVKCGIGSSDLSEKLDQSKSEGIVVLGVSHPSKELAGKDKVGLVGPLINDDLSQIP